MKLGEEILKILAKTYEPHTLVEMPFKRYDLAFKTDEAGRPVILFLGKLDGQGRIKGERFARRLLFDHEGKVLKDHWENKGKTG